MVDGSIRVADESTTSAPAAVDAPSVDRRSGTDRRRFSWRTLAVGAVRPRRRRNRRGADANGEGLLDWYEPRLVVLAITILLLSMADAFLTLNLIGRGATEANPVMAYVLERAPRLFTAVKMGLTGMGVVFLVVLSRARVFGVIRISAIIHWCLLGYVLLIFYELWLLRQAV